MQRFVQFVAGVGAMFLAAAFLHETPLNHGGVYVPIFIGTMYAVALVQHRLHWRSVRGKAARTPGAAAGRDMARGP